MNDIKLVLPFIFGYFCVTPLLDAIGMESGIEGIEYYAEVHQSKWNCWVHSFGMLFTVYGISCWVPALFQLSPENRVWMQYYVWVALFSHYMSINFLQGFFCLIWYAIPMICANEKVSSSDMGNWNMFWHGFLVSFISLACQEFFGHYLGGDDPSRPEAVPNAIAYATLFSTWHIF